MTGGRLLVALHTLPFFLSSRVPGGSLQFGGCLTQIDPETERRQEPQPVEHLVALLEEECLT